MSLRNFILISVFAMSSVLAGCGGSEVPKNAGNTAANTNTANGTKTNAANVVAVTTPTPDTEANAAPTLTPVYKAFCAAVVKKDEAAIRKFYSSDTLESFEEQMKGEGIKSLSEFLKDDKISNELCEISNERVKGDKAVARLKSGSCPNGCEVLFVKESGEWKLSNMDVKTF